MMYRVTDPGQGVRIRRARERKRWTQQQLADALGVGLRTVGSWERGEAEPRNSLGALVALLGEAVLGEPEPDPRAEQIKALGMDPADEAEFLEALRIVQQQAGRKAG